NGTQPAPSGIDWLCVSPKAGSEVVQRHGDELKLVHPQDGAPPEAFEGWDVAHFSLQPMDGPNVAANTQRCIEHCLANPRWQLSLQTHKVLGIP
ncbi:MAG: Radical domain protein, partial [Acidimicrobiales bacterium]|nr:Radical domain protein [Acidimicrobiales bacterium]